MRTECGIYAVLGRSITYENVYNGMKMIQHRGQDSYGIIVIKSDDAGDIINCSNRVTPNNSLEIDDLREFGLIPDKLDIDLCDSHNTKLIGILGHTRYSTVCATLDRDAIQPILLSDVKDSAVAIRDDIMAYISYNGNIPNYLSRLDVLGLSELDGPSDTYLFRGIWQKYCNTSTTPHHKLAEFCIQNIPGAYSCVYMINASNSTKLIGFRDRYGYKPLWYYILPCGIQGFISETRQLLPSDLANPGLQLCEVMPGMCVVLEYGKLPVIIKCFGDFANNSNENPPTAKCSMESIYFMHEDSMVTLTDSIYDIKKKLGGQLALEESLDIVSVDTEVIYVPESSYPIADKYAEITQIPFNKDVIRKIYNIRSFIENNTEARIGKIKRKFEFNFDKISCKNIIIVDDSLVRGNTMRYIIAELKRYNPELRIHIRIASPPLVNKCYFGIDIAEKDELIWHDPVIRGDLSKLAEYFGVNTVRYLSLRGLTEVLGVGHCQYCFGDTSDANRKTLEW